MELGLKHTNNTASCFPPHLGDVSPMRTQNVLLVLLVA